MSNAQLDALLLLCHVLGVDKPAILAHPERALEPEETATFDALLARRLQDEPIAYLLGEREFFGHRFRVTPAVLIPRPETELLVELGVAAVERWRARGVEQPTIVEVGTGCGAVAISVALACGLPVLATDVSAAAIAVATENARWLGAAGYVRFTASDLLEGLSGPIHVLLANLPYVPDERILPREVGVFEPEVALYGGPTGTELNRRLLEQARTRLVPGAEAALEMDEEDQAATLLSAARSLFPAADVRVELDGAGADRVLHLVLPR